MRLTILTVTMADACVLPLLRATAQLAWMMNAELVLAADGDAAERTLKAMPELSFAVRRVDSKGYIESVLDEALSYCRGEYVFRIDDDERVSGALRAWLKRDAYMTSPHWKLPRAHLWGNGRFIVDAPLWPDHQTRLSLRELSGGRHAIHCGSPHGGGEESPAVLEHWIYAVRPLDERRAKVRHYDTIQAGAGTHFRAFQTPEDVFDKLTVAPLGDGSFAAIEAAERETLPLRGAA